MLKLAKYPIQSTAVFFKVEFMIPYFQELGRNVSSDLSYSLKPKTPWYLTEGQKLIIAVLEGEIQISFVDKGPPGQSGPNDGEDDEAAE
jgi:hypothetical protein